MTGGTLHLTGYGWAREAALGTVVVVPSSAEPLLLVGTKMKNSSLLLSSSLPPLPLPVLRLVLLTLGRIRPWEEESW